MNPQALMGWEVGCGCKLTWLVEVEQFNASLTDRQTALFSASLYLLQYCRVRFLSPSWALLPESACFLQPLPP